MLTPKTRDVYRGTPFRVPLRNEFPGRSGKIMRLAHDGRVVRVLQGWNEKDLGELKRFSEALRQDGIRVPQYDVLRAQRWDRPGKQATYIVTESIVGERLDEIARPRDLDWLLPISRSFYEKLYEALDHFVPRLMNHYLRILEEGGLVFSAMDQSQFVYGTCKADRWPAIYFVDLDPTYSVVRAMKERKSQVNPNEAKADFEKPINILFEMEMLHPEGRFLSSNQAATEYFGVCSAFFHDFYGRSTPWWARAPNFEHYQRMKERLLGM